MPVCEIQSLTVAYGSKVALRDLTCSIPEGCVGLLGPNGAGKTTLIKTLLGFVQPRSGSASLLGYDVTREPLQVRMEVGLMPEQDCHIPGVTAVEYVAYLGELSGMPRNQALRRAHEVLDYCGLTDARYRQIQTYSTGMKQKVKLAQALVHGPRLVFLDEPTNGLDPEAREEVLTMIRDISHGKGVNCVVSSHLLPDIERTCDFVIVLHQGELRMAETVEAMRQMSRQLWEVELKEPVEQFAREIESLGAKVVWNISNQYRIHLADGDLGVSRLVFEAARKSGAQVRGLRQSQKTLEEAFMEALE
jgi:ABC-2 type transport system ATP-binding protein